MTHRTDENCQSCLRGCVYVGTPNKCYCPCHTPTDESVVEWEKEFLKVHPIMTDEYGGVERMYIRFIRSLLTSQSIKHKAEVEKARKEERERIRKFFKESSDDWSVNSDNWVKLDELLTNKES